MKSELRVLNPGNQKRKWNDRGIRSEIVTKKNLLLARTRVVQRHQRSLVPSVGGQTVLQLSVVQVLTGAGGVEALTIDYYLP